MQSYHLLKNLYEVAGSLTGTLYKTKVANNLELKIINSLYLPACSERLTKQRSNNTDQYTETSTHHSPPLTPDPNHIMTNIRGK